MVIATGLTAARMQEIIDRQIVSGAVDLSGNLVMTREDGSSFNAGAVKGAKGDSAIYTLPGFPSAGSVIYVRLATLDGVAELSGASAQFTISGIGGYGTPKRATVLVHISQRGADQIDLKAWHWGLDEVAHDSLRLYTRKLGTYLYEVWAAVGAYTFKPTIMDQAKQNATLNVDGNTTVAPSSLVQGTIIHASSPIATATEVADGTSTDKVVSPASLRDSGGGNPPGVICMWSTAVAPNGFLLCRGQAVSRTTYARLYAVIGTTYGAGDGSTTFNVPNFQGRVPVGQDSTQTEFDVLGETGGSKTHTLTIPEMPYHNHGTGAPSGGNIGYGENSGGPALYTVGYGPTRPAAEPVTGTTGENQPHNNLQPYIVLNYIIAHGGRSDLEPVPVPTPVVRFAAFGDSITSVWMPTPDALTYTGYSWIPHLDGSKFEHVGGYAHGGYTTAQVAANATAVECDLAVVMLGTNDVGPPPWGTEWSIVRQGLIDIVTKSNAPRALICAAPPRNNDAPLGTAEAQRTLEHNERVRLLALDMGWGWVDPWFTVRAPSGQWAHQTLTDDGIHPTPVAAARCARDISSAMQEEAS